MEQVQLQEPRSVLVWKSLAILPASQPLGTCAGGLGGSAECPGMGQVSSQYCCCGDYGLLIVNCLLPQRRRKRDFEKKEDGKDISPAALSVCP